MAAALHVGMGKLVHQHELRPPGDDGVEVHFLEPLTFVLDAPAGNDLEPGHQRFGFAAAVGFHHPDNDVVAVFLARVRLLQHLIGLADAGRGADKDPKLADAAFLAPCRFEERLRRRPLVGCAPLIRHHRSDLSTSGSPR